MPSKKSAKRRPKAKSAPAGSNSFKVKEAWTCLSEVDLRRRASAWAETLHPGDRVLLEGEMGAGKSTFARFLIEAWGADRPSEGSPTFALAHEYRSARGEIIHIDLYRLRAESEIDDAGIPDYFWSRPALVICEWLSLWPEFESRVVGASPGRRNFRVQITIDDADHRSVRISCGG